VPPLTKAEATCIIFDEALREGHHLLRFPVRLLMGLLKNGSESPRYLRILVGLVCRRGVFDNVAQELDALASTLPQLIANDLLPSLESIHNRDGACHDMVKGLDPRKAPQQQQRHVEQLLKLIIAFGSRGFTEGDVHECLADAVPDRNRVALVRALAPVLHVGRHCGHVRYALTCPYTAHAITQRYCQETHPITNHQSPINERQCLNSQSSSLNSVFDTTKPPSLSPIVPLSLVEFLDPRI